MTSELFTLIAFLSKDLNNIKNQNDFEQYIDKDDKRKLLLLKSDEFWDFPFNNLPVLRDDKNSIIYVYRFRLLHDVTNEPTYIKVMYINSVHGAFIAFDLVNKEIASDIGSSSIGMSHVIVDLGQGHFQFVNSPNFYKLVYHPELDKYFAILTCYQELYQHPWYAQNKLLDNFQD